MFGWSVTAVKVEQARTTNLELVHTEENSFLVLAIAAFEPCLARFHGHSISTKDIKNLISMKSFILQRCKEMTTVSAQKNFTSTLSSPSKLLPLNSQISIL